MTSSPPTNWADGFRAELQRLRDTGYCRARQGGEAIGELAHREQRKFLSSLPPGYVEETPPQLAARDWLEILILQASEQTEPHNNKSDLVDGLGGESSEGLALRVSTGTSLSTRGRYSTRGLSTTAEWVTTARAVHPPPSFGELRPSCCGSCPVAFCSRTGGPWFLRGRYRPSCTHARDGARLRSERCGRKACAGDRGCPFRRRRAQRTQ